MIPRGRELGHVEAARGERERGVGGERDRCWGRGQPSKQIMHTVRGQESKGVVTPDVDVLIRQRV